jgi:hypothetical protein
LLVHDFFHCAFVFFLPPQTARHGPSEGGEGGGEAFGGGEGGGGLGGRHRAQPLHAVFLHDLFFSFVVFMGQTLAVPHLGDDGGTPHCASHQNGFCFPPRLEHMLAQ